jgi:hypothetical protein
MPMSKLSVIQLYDNHARRLSAEKAGVVGAVTTPMPQKKA